MGRIVRHHRVRLRRHARRNLRWNVRAVGRPRADRSEPPVVVPPAVSFDRRRPDLRPGIIVLHRRGAHPADRHRLFARRRPFRRLSDRADDVFLGAIARPLLVRNFRSDRMDLRRQRRAILVGAGEEHAAAAVGLQRQLARGVPLQPAALDRGRRTVIGDDLGAVPDVGRGAGAAVADQARGASAHRRRGRSEARASSAGADRIAGPPSLRRGDDASAICHAQPPPNARHPARGALLGNRRADDRDRRQQRPVRRPHRRTGRLAGHVPHAPGRGGRRDAVLLHRRRPLRR